MRGTPLRLKSTPLFSADQGKPSCRSLPASSSMWMRCRRTRAEAAAGGDLHVPVGGQRLVVLRDLVALRQVRVEVVLAREDRRRLHGAAAWPARRGWPGSPRGGSARAARPGSPRHTGQTLVLGGVAEAVAAAAEDLGRGQELDVDLEADDRLVPRQHALPGRGRRGHGPAIVPLELAAAEWANGRMQPPRGAGPRLLPGPPGVRAVLQPVPRARARSASGCCSCCPTAS